MRCVLLLLMIAFLPFSMPAQIGAMANKGTTRAVIVGISDYQDEGIPPLRFAHRDALAMADFLQSTSGGNVAPEHIKLLMNKDATRGEVTTAFYWLDEETQPGDRAIIYFSGHGDTENKFRMPQGYLLAYDAKPSNYMGSGALRVSDLQLIVQGLSLKDVEVILITDACRAGHLAGSDQGGVIATNEGLAKIFTNGVKILSCEPAQASLESENWGGGRGIFSFFLIEGLKGLADENEDLKVNLKEIGRYLEDEVSRWADQDPMTEGPSSKELFRVDADTLFALRERTLLGKEAMASVTSRSTLPSSGRDTVVHPLFRQFQQAMAMGHLLYPEAGSAYALFQQMEEEQALQPILSAQRLNLAAALQDGAQQAINAYLDASPEEMARRWQYDASYQYYPEYLDRAAELLGPGNIFYDDLKGRQAYFEGLVLRLRGETLPNGDSLFRQAILKQELALSRDSLAAHAYNELGLVYRRMKQYRKSLAYFEEAHDLSPTWVVPAGNISASLLDIGRLDEAASMAQQTLELKADYVPPRYNLGKIAFLNKNYREAISRLEDVILYDSNYYKAYLLLGDCWARLDSLTQAQQAYLKYLELQPSSAPGYNKLGLISRRLGEYSQAIAYYQQALDLQSDFSDPANNLGWLYLSQLEDYPSAEQYYRLYVQLEPEDSEGMVMVACTLAMQEDREGALQWLERALEKGFDSYEDLRTASFLLNVQSDPRFIDLLSRYEN